MPYGQKVHGKGQHVKLEGSLLDLSLCYSRRGINT